MRGEVDMKQITGRMEDEVKNKERERKCIIKERK